MGLLKFKYKRELGTDVFSYSMSMKGETIYRMVDTNTDSPTIQEERSSNKTVNLILEVPKKKIVYDTDYGIYIDYDKAKYIYDDEYLKEHTREVDDTELFEKIHRHAYKMLYNKFKEII